MDYSFFPAAPQPYQFMGMAHNGYPHTGVEADTIHSIVRIGEIASSSMDVARCLLQAPHLPKDA